MTPKEFTEIHKTLNAELQAVKAEINAKFTAHAVTFIEANSPVKKHVVYELKANGKKHFRYNRFVIFAQSVQFLSGNPIINVGGWWLNKFNVPSKWDTMTVFGIGNPAAFSESENQKFEKHPAAKKQ